MNLSHLMLVQVLSTSLYDYSTWSRMLRSLLGQVRSRYTLVQCRERLTSVVLKALIPAQHFREAARLRDAVQSSLEGRERLKTRFQKVPFCPRTDARWALVLVPVGCWKNLMIRLVLASHHVGIA